MKSMEDNLRKMEAIIQQMDQFMINYRQQFMDPQPSIEEFQDQLSGQGKVDFQQANDEQSTVDPDERLKPIEEKLQFWQGEVQGETEELQEQYVLLDSNPSTNSEEWEFFGANSNQEAQHQYQSMDGVLGTGLKPPEEGNESGLKIDNGVQETLKVILVHAKAIDYDIPAGKVVVCIAEMMEPGEIRMGDNLFEFLSISTAQEMFEKMPIRDFREFDPGGRNGFPLLKMLTFVSDPGVSFCISRFEGDCIDELLLNCSIWIIPWLFWCELVWWETTVPVLLKWVVFDPGITASLHCCVLCSQSSSLKFFGNWLLVICPWRLNPYLLVICPLRFLVLWLLEISPWTCDANFALPNRTIWMIAWSQRCGFVATKICELWVQADIRNWSPATEFAQDYGYVTRSIKANQLNQCS